MIANASQITAILLTQKIYEIMMGILPSFLNFLRSAHNKQIHGLIIQAAKICLPLLFILIGANADICLYPQTLSTSPW